jgi:hypothetical protein
MKIRNSLVGALIVSSSAFAAVYGAAATFDLNGGTVQQAADTTLECQTNPVSVQSWGINSSDDAVTGGKVTFVQVVGVDASCAGKRLMGRVESRNGDLVGYLTGIDPNTGGAKNFADSVTLATGFNKFQLIEPDGSHGIDANPIDTLRLWIEGSDA